MIESASKMAPSQKVITDEQMEDMLARATARMREKEEAKMFAFPELNAGGFARSPVHCVYVRRQCRRLDGMARPSSSIMWILITNIADENFLFAVPTLEVASG